MELEMKMENFSSESFFLLINFIFYFYFYSYNYFFGMIKTSLHVVFHCFSCWLSVEQGTIFAFVAPMMAIIIVRIKYIYSLCTFVVVVGSADLTVIVMLLLLGECSFSWARTA